MSDESTPIEEPPPFRWTPQVLVIYGVTLIMLTIPLALVCWSVLSIFQPVAAPESAPVEAPAELRQSLEKAAETSLKPAELGSEQRVTLPGPDRVSATAKFFGATAVEMEPGRYWVRLPGGRRESFIQAAQTGEKPELIPGDPGEVILLEVIVKAKETQP